MKRFALGLGLGIIVGVASIVIAFVGFLRVPVEAAGTPGVPTRR